LLAIALLVAIGVSPCAARKKDKHEIPAVSLPDWVQEAVARAPESSDQEVVWLHDEMVVRPEPVAGVTVTRRIVGKVFKQSGLGILSGTSLYYVKGDRIRKLAAWTLRPDGTAYRADPTDDVSDLPALGDADIFYDSRVQVIESHGVVIGSVVAFESMKWSLLDVGFDGFTFGESERPTLLSRFELQVPEGWTWETVVKRGDDLEEELAESRAVYVGRDLQPLKSEPRRPTAARILPAVYARWVSPDGKRGFESWDQVGLWTREMSEAAMQELGEASALAKQFKQQEGEELTAAVARAFEYAARDIRYVAIDVGLGIGAGYRPATPASVCDKRYGDCKDKSYLMRALAEPWGVKTYPVLVRTIDRGPVMREVPSPGQFNHCIAAVELPDGVGSKLWNVAEIEGLGRLVFLDATAREGSPWGLPWGVQGTTALVVHPGGGKLVKLPMQPPDADTTRREIDVQIDDEGTIVRATVVEQWNGETASRIRNYYSGMSEKQHRADVLEDLQGRFPGAQVAEYTIEGLDEVLHPVVETTIVEGGRLGKRVGDLLILEPGKTGYGLLGGTLPKPPRKWSFNVGRPREEVLHISIVMPQGWVPEEIPKPLEVDSDYLGAGAEWALGEGKVTYDRRMSLLRSKVPVDDYAAFRETLLQVRNVDRQAVVLIKE
jgi:hypothetical protein